MCGIMGYVGPQQAAPIVLEGLRRLEYRGYDSAGLAIIEGDGITVRKAAGKIANLDAVLSNGNPKGTLGIGHTRWATHGPPTDSNAHPHTNMQATFAVVHNGIIENFADLKAELEESGVEFVSQTDTEVLAHLVGQYYDGDLREAVRKAVDRAVGAYALVVMTSHEPDHIVAVRMISPLVVGFGDGEMFLASGVPALLEHTRSMMVIEDGEMVSLTADGAVVTTIGGEPVDRSPVDVEWDIEAAEKGGFDHFMLKEIHEQPEVVAETLMGRIDGDHVDLNEVGYTDEFATDLRKIWITACGTAYHAGLVGKQLFEGLLRIPTEVVYAHELRYSDPLIEPGDLVIAISQSGETVDTLVAARLAKQLGGRLVAITNVPGSALSHEADDTIYTRAGIEISVASTKAYVAMVVVQYLLAMDLGQRRKTLSADDQRRLGSGLIQLPGALETIIGHDDEIARVAETLVNAEDIYFIGRGLDYAVVMEGSLKLKEISYIHSEAMPAGELKHGTLALVTKGTPVVVVLTQEATYHKTLSAVQEVKARGAYVIGVGYEDDDQLDRYVDEVIRIPRVEDLYAPVPAAVPLQLLAYHVARLRGLDIDQPRNLAKSVTVE